MKEGVYIDPYLLSAVGAFFTFIVIPGLGWLFKQLWTDRNDAYKENVVLLKAQFTDADTRKELWTKLGDTVKDQTREVMGLKQAWGEFLAEYRRKNP